MAKKCKHRVGLITLTDCDEPSVEQCKSCNRPICEAHMEKRLGSVYCLECYATDHPPEREELEKADADSARSSVFRRRDYYQQFYFLPLYSGRHHHHYAHDSYRTFEADEDFEGGAGEASEGIDSDDFLDS